MEPFPISIQLYSLREEAKGDFPAVLAKVAEIGYAGVEFAGLHGMSPADVKKAIDDLGLVASSTHGPFPTKENVNEIVDTAKTLGYTRHVSGIGPKDWETKEKAEASAARVREATEVLDGTGIAFGYHNHWWEFEKEFDGKTPHAILMEAAPGVFAQVDTYWVQVGGKDAAAIVRDLGPRAPTLHIKDGPLDREKAMTAVGAGEMDWDAVVGAASSETEWLVVELDRCDTDMTDAVTESYRFLTSAGLAKGKK